MTIQSAPPYPSTQGISNPGGRSEKSGSVWSMPLHGEIATHSSRAAFSLVEITLALGIIAFALLAIFGLLPVAYDASRSAQQDASRSRVVQSAAAMVRSLGYRRLTTSNSSHWAETSRPFGRLPWYFDYHGNPLPNAGVDPFTPPSEGYFIVGLHQSPTHATTKDLAKFRDHFVTGPLSTNSTSLGSSERQLEFFMDIRFPAVNPSEAVRVPMTVANYD